MPGFVMNLKLNYFYSTLVVSLCHQGTHFSHSLNIAMNMQNIFDPGKPQLIA